MAKQKRKVTEVTGEKNKKLKKASAEETLRAPEATQGTKEARPKVGACGRVGLTAFPQLEGDLGGRNAGIGRGDTEDGTSYTWICSVPSENNSRANGNCSKFEAGTP